MLDKAQSACQFATCHLLHAHGSENVYIPPQGFIWVTKHEVKVSGSVREIKWQVDLNQRAFDWYFSKSRAVSSESSPGSRTSALYLYSEVYNIVMCDTTHDRTHFLQQ